MEPRIQNPALSVPGALPALQRLSKAIDTVGVPSTLLELVHLRASQINGCGVCVDLHARDLGKAGETPERLASVAAWRETPYFTAAERAALALAEAVTRLSDTADPVPDDTWAEATRHFEEDELAALTLSIAAVNLWNRVNAATRQIAGAW